MIAAPPKTPVTRYTKTGRTAKKYYTIHNFPNTIMAVKLNGYEKMNTSVVSFNNHNDAILVGKMIENHRTRTKDWPVFNFEDLQDDNTFRLSNYNGTSTVLMDNMYVQEWNEIDDLKMYCVAHFFDLITLNRLSTSKEGFRMNGNIFKFEADQQFYTQRLEYLYNK
jgi:hypothetical protein